MSSAERTLPLTIIKPSRGGGSIDLKALWEYRELLYFLTWRDVKIRYKQTLLGASWAVLQPLFGMIIFTVFFGRLARVPSEGVPHPIFYYSGLLLWTYFASAVSLSSNSLVGKASLVTKVYFPRLLMPVASTLAGVLDYVIAATILVVLMLFYRISPGASMFLLPFLMLCAWLCATGVGLWLSALNVKYRDVRYLVPFLTQLWLFATPVIYPTSMLPQRYQWILSINPMAGVIEAHRACILGHHPIDWGALLVSLGVMIIVFCTGAVYFARMERTFADII